MNFNDFYWHDSIIKSIYIDRSNPGKKDEIPPLTRTCSPCVVQR
jgi:hypothetical protein